jgi:ankyrin repeat protein
MQLFRAVKNSRKPTGLRRSAKYAAMALCVCLGACTGTSSDQPTPEAAKRFLKLRGYDFDEQSFFKAAADGDVMAVNGFISAGINVNARNADDDTALTASAARGDAKIVEALLRGGADVNAKGRNTWTALLLALSEDHDIVTDVLLAQPNIDFKAENPEGMTALMLAVWHQREQAVASILKRGGDVNHQDKDGDAAVHGTALYGNARILKLLLDGGANPNVKNALGGTALMWAAAYGHEEIVSILLSRGADPKIRDLDGVTAAGWAAKNSRSSIELMLKAAERNQ